VREKMGKALEIVLEDRGKKVDRAKLCDARLRTVSPGVGAAFIRESMDALEFRARMVVISSGS